MTSRSETGKAAVGDASASQTTPQSEQAELRRVTISGRVAIKKLVLDPGQEQFAGSVDAVFDDLQNSQYRHWEHAFAIVVSQKTVGFFILREKQALPDWAPRGTVTLHSFRISRACQGKGYGRASVGLAISWVRQNLPDVRQLMLAVNTRNVAAKSLYLRTGFVDTGKVFLGPIGDQNILTMEIPCYGV